jgi:Leucine-rich repeat (LRR) protein
MIIKLKVDSLKFKVVFLLLCCIGISFTASAQKKNQNKTQNKGGLTKEELAIYETEISQMVNYLQETLNFIGDPEQTAQEKEIVFSQSYTKIFQDDKVQIEDDLDTQRNANLTKDVQAYLKDIDFFFKYARFSFDIQNIASLSKDDGTPYFKVTLNRQLIGKTVTNDSINEVKIRYIEINLDKVKNDLKIASIYTTKVNERESLSHWWNTMPSAWKNYFGGELFINKTIPLKSVMQINETDFIYALPELSVIDGDTVATDWKEIVMKEGLDEIYAKLKGLVMMNYVDVSDIKTITTLEPLSELSELNVLNIANTNINDLTPLRNANKLKVLKAANTRIEDLSALKYDIMLEELDVSHTDVSNLAVLDILTNLEKLNISNTQVNTLDKVRNCPKMAYLSAEGCHINTIAPLKDLEGIVALNISNTSVNDLNPLSHLTSLQSLKISQTPVKNLYALQEMKSLKELYCSNTNINDLTPLQNHRLLSKIYCDNTRIDDKQASEFTKNNPFTLVIFDTNALEQWWDNLPIYWKAVFSKQTSIDGEPTTEQLHEVINMTELDLSGNQYLQDLIPVSRLTNLVTLNISHTEITSLMPLTGMTNLEYINCDHTFVNDLRALAGMSRLKELIISNTPVENLEPLETDTHLETVWAENSSVGKRQADALKRAVPSVTVIYQTEAIQNWWDELDPTWKRLLLSQIGNTNYNPSALELQQILNLKTINIEQENVVQSLEPLLSLTWLEKVSITNQGIRDISPLANKPHLSELLIQNNPITDISPLEYDTLLSVLNIENTQVSDLSKLEKLTHLRTLNASGTNVKSLKPLAKLNELEELLVNNTNVKNISPIENLPSLKLLKIYNTKVKNKAVNALQQKRFDLNIVYY